MKVNYIGANVRKGVSEKTGNPYTIARVLYSVPAESRRKMDQESGREVYNFVAHGHQVREIDLDPSKLSRFEAVAPGAEVVLTLEPNPDNPQRNHVTGIA